MLNPADLQRLSSFDPSPFLVTSLYLNTDPKRFPKAALTTQLKDLSRDRFLELRGAGLTREQLQSVESDFERLQDFLTGHPIGKAGERGLALFCCAGRDFFLSCALPRGFKATLLAGPTPYLRPLQALLAQSPRSLVVLVDQHRARAWTLAVDEIADAFDVANETGSRIKKGGFQGRETSRTEHRHDEAVHHHYQDVADRILHVFQAAPFDHLVLAGHLDELRGFERHLHAYVAERVAGRFRADVRSATREEVRIRAQEIVGAEEARRREDAVQRLLGASRTNGGLAVTGLRSTLAVLNDRRVLCLLVDEELSASGRRCAACDTLFEMDETCPRCSGPTHAVADVVEEALALTVHQGGTLRFLPTGSAIGAHGKIGAMLRY